MSWPIRIPYRVRRAARVIWRRGSVSPRTLLTGAETRGGQLVLRGLIMGPPDPAPMVFRLRKFRAEGTNWSFPLTLIPQRKPGLRGAVSRALGLGQHSFEVTLDLDWATLAATILSPCIETENGQRHHFHTIEGGARVVSDDAPDDVPSRTWHVFREPSIKSVRIELYHFGTDTVAGLTRAGQGPRPAGLSCVLGEYTNTARDNAWVLFRRLREKAPDITAHYALETQNLDGIDTGRDGVLTWGSDAHLRACLDAHVCAFTHHRPYPYPRLLHTIAPARDASVRTLLLQHGVMAMKGGAITRELGFVRNGYDAVVVSSQGERRIFHDHFGYPLDSVHATGLPRLDDLYARARTARPDPDRVLVFPTWRRGLEKLDSAQVADHPFFVNWAAALRGMVQAGLKPVLILHPILHRHTALLADCGADIRTGADFQDSLLGASAFVTDYSSTAFDALYLGKPVTLLQFDRDDFGLARDAFIDIDTELPGVPVATPAQAVQALTQQRAAGWPGGLADRQARYFDHTDGRNADRVADLIRTLARQDG